MILQQESLRLHRPPLEMQWLLLWKLILMLRLLQLLRWLQLILLPLKMLRQL